MQKRTAFELTRDWRVRTIVPIVLVNIIAFGGLYLLMYHFAMSNLIATDARAADLLFDDLRLYYEDPSIEHRVVTVSGRLARHAEAHKLFGLSLYDTGGAPIIDVGPEPPALARTEAERALKSTAARTIWAISEDNHVIFDRTLENVKACHGCHDATYPRLGVMQLSWDLTQPIADAKQRVQQKFALAGVMWIGVLALLFGAGRYVIGRPISQIEKSIGGRGSNLEELAHRVDARLWELIDAQRKREEDIARQMVRAEQLAALGEVAAGLTHEIKNPVAGVIAVLDLLRSESDANRELYDQMLSELRRVSTTLDSLLRLARPQPPQRADVDMGRVVREIATLFDARLRRQGVTLELELSESIPTLQLDHQLMVQLLVNLLTNAMQATDRGGSVKVLLAPFPRYDGVVLAVQDSGRGVPPEYLDRIFVPFFTTKEEGTGLGLAICRQIVEQHGGTIGIESEEGRGTRVFVVLPKSTRPAEEEEVVEEEATEAEENDGVAAAG